jgi:hypothetical protein
VVYVTRDFGPLTHKHVGAVFVYYSIEDSLWAGPAFNVPTFVHYKNLVDQTTNGELDEEYWRKERFLYHRW